MINLNQGIILTLAMIVMYTYQGGRKDSVVTSGFRIKNRNSRNHFIDKAVKELNLKRLVDGQ